MVHSRRGRLGTYPAAAASSKLLDDINDEGSAPLNRLVGVAPRVEKEEEEEVAAVGVVLRLLGLLSVGLGTRSEDIVLLFIEERRERE